MTLDVALRASRDSFDLEAALTAAEGETVAVLGPNGSGKSTLVEVLAGLLRPDTGRITLDGTVLDDVGSGTHVEPELRPVGVVFQDLQLFPHLSAIENVAFPLRARGTSRREAALRSRELLGRLGLGDHADALPDTLSGGQAQRVALARALVYQPRLLLLDEPLSALDVRARGRIRELIRETLSGFPGIRLLVTHDPVEAMTLADRLVVLEEGRVTQAGTGEEVRDAPRTPYVAELVGRNLFAGRLEPLEAGTGKLRALDGEVIVGWPAGVPAEPISEVLGLLRPADISLHAERPEGSARNVLRGRIAAISLEGERARVRVQSAPPVVSEITLGSIERLGLAVGGEVWLSFKAVEVSLVLP